MEKDMKTLKKVKTILLVMVVIVWTIVGIGAIKVIVETKKLEKERLETIQEEREYLTEQYNELKSSMANDIVVIANAIQGNATLEFSRSEKDELLEAYGNIVDLMKQGNTTDKITEMDEHNLDIYSVITIIHEDLKGFTTNFAVAIDNKNLNALDNSVKYLSKMTDTMNNIETEMKNQKFLK